MENLLLKTLNVLILINQQIGGNIISTTEVQEEKKNIQDFINFKNNLNTLLDDLSNSENLKNKEWVNKRLIDLHLKYFDAIWHLDQMHELIEKFIKAYPN